MKVNLGPGHGRMYSMTYLCQVHTVLHIDALHIRNPSHGTHGLILCTVLTSWS